MNEFIKAKLETLPHKSGVYLMRDIDGNVIYIGKAKKLKNRVSQYFNKKMRDSGYNLKVKAMVDKIYDFDYFITLSELDALALESNLIKKHQPFYNILLKDGKAFPYIKIDVKNPFPKLEIVRKIKNDRAKYFGPYFAGISANEMMKIIQTAFSVRTCNLKFNSKSKPPARECLNYLLNLCPAPCTNKITSEEYSKTIEKIIDFLNGNDNLVEKLLKEKMLKESEKENFEKALELRNQIKMIQRLKEKVIAQVPQKKEIDVFAYETNNLSGAISLLIVRGGKILGVQTISTRDASLDESEALSSFIVQYYANAKLPQVILISHNIQNLNELKQLLNESGIDIETGQKGYKKLLLDMAKINAKEHLGKSLTRDRQKFEKSIGAILNLQKALELKNTPKRMECYDISNTQGTNSVASMVVFINGEKQTKHYRKFKIKTVEGPNDYESLKEVIIRRLNELKKGEDESFKQKPDLIVIDGGKGQLSVTADVVLSQRPDIEIIAIAEKFDEIFKPNNSMPYILKKGSVELRVLQNIRDEAHRFANAFHRDLRQKQSLSSPLSNIKGLGTVKQKALINQFKTIDNIKSASIEELMLVKGIHLNLAKNIYKYFHHI
ncbi:MAG: excinuclease ABC subunit UvrC [Clostridia bacterium]|nr:excinuclease ABC subunit UvrC [Clostridia bacterium]MDD4686258.1 excinuclease ABC subunit UvrC [Clostridia bacterium]